MNKILAITLCLTLSLSIPIPANAGGTQPNMATADWSVNSTRNLASHPPSLDAVQDFYDQVFGDEESWVKVCEFRFADLQNSGNLSLIITLNPEGRQWPECNQLYILDRKGLDIYTTDRAYGDDLAHSVLDINHDGRHELVLWGDLLNATGYYRSRRVSEVGCDAKWPLVFAWTGIGYSEVGDQYKNYYRNYLKSLEAQLAAYSSESGSAAAQTANPTPMPRIGEFSVSPGGEGPGLVSGPVLIAPAPTPEAAPTPRPRDYACTRIEAAKTEAFLGINSDSTMSAAIKDSESADPNKRILAAVIFSYLGSQEAKADLKTLSNDADSEVAAIAKRAASRGEDPDEFYRRITPGGPGSVIPPRLF